MKRLFVLSILLCMILALISFISPAVSTAPVSADDEPSPPPMWLGVWGRSASDVFLVGGPPGIIWHYDGNSWEVMTSGTEHSLRDVWGSSDNNVFAVGHTSTILHYDGSNWNSMTSNTTQYLFGVWGNSDNNDSIHFDNP